MNYYKYILIYNQQLSYYNIVITTCKYTMDLKLLTEIIISNQNKLKDIGTSQFVFVMGDAQQGKSFVTAILADASFYYKKQDQFQLKGTYPSTQLKFLNDVQLSLGQSQTANKQKQIGLYEIKDLTVLDWVGNMTTLMIESQQLPNYFFTQKILNKVKELKILYVIKQQYFLNRSLLKEGFKKINTLLEMFRYNLDIYKNVILVVNRCSKFQNVQLFRKYLQNQIIAVAESLELGLFPNVFRFMKYYSENGLIQLVQYIRPQKLRPRKFTDQRSTLVKSIETLTQYTNPRIIYELDEKIQTSIIDYGFIQFSDTFAKIYDFVTNLQKISSAKDEISATKHNQIFNILTLYESNLANFFSLDSRLKQQAYLNTIQNFELRKFLISLVPSVYLINILMTYIKPLREKIGKKYNEEFDRLSITIKNIKQTLMSNIKNNYVEHTDKLFEETKNIENITIKFMKIKFEDLKNFNSLSNNFNQTFDSFKEFFTIYNNLVAPFKNSKVDFPQFVNQHFNLFQSHFKSIKVIENSKEYVSFSRKASLEYYSLIEKMLKEAPNIISMEQSFKDSKMKCRQIISLIEMERLIEETITELINQSKEEISSVMNNLFAKIEKRKRITSKEGISSTNLNYKDIVDDLKIVYKDLIELQKSKDKLFGPKVDEDLMELKGEGTFQLKKNVIERIRLINTLIRKLPKLKDTSKMAFNNFFSDINSLISQQITRIQRRSTDFIDPINAELRQNIEDLMFLTTKYLSVKRNELKKLKTKDTVQQLLRIFTQELTRFRKFNQLIKKLKTNEINFRGFIVNHYNTFVDCFEKYNEIKITNGYSFFKDKYLLSLVSDKEYIQKEISHLQQSEFNLDEEQALVNIEDINEIDLEDFTTNFFNVLVNIFKESINIYLKSFKQRYYYNPYLIMNEYKNRINRLCKEADAQSLIKGVEEISMEKIQLNQSTVIDLELQEHQITGLDTLYYRVKQIMDDRFCENFLRELRQYIQKDYKNNINSSPQQDHNIDMQEKNELKKKNLELEKQLSELKVKYKSMNQSEERVRELEKQNKEVGFYISKSIEHVDTYLKPSSKAQLVPLNKSFRDQSEDEDTIEQKSNRLKNFIFKLKKSSCLCFQYFY